MKSNSIQNITMITCKEEMVKIKSNSPQKSMWKRVNIKSNTVQNTMVITCMQKSWIKSNTKQKKMVTTCMWRRRK